MQQVSNACARTNAPRIESNERVIERRGHRSADGARLEITSRAFCFVIEAMNQNVGRPPLVSRSQRAASSKQTDCETRTDAPPFVIISHCAITVITALAGGLLSKRPRLRIPRLLRMQIERLGRLLFFLN